MKIEIMGSGCANCRKLEKNAIQAVKEMGLRAEIVKVEDIMEIADRGVLMTPAIAVDGIVRSSGKVLTPEEIKRLLKA